MMASKICKEMNLSQKHLVQKIVYNPSNLNRKRILKWKMLQNNSFMAEDGTYNIRI